MNSLVMVVRSGVRTNALNGNRPRRAGAHGCVSRAFQQAFRFAADGGGAP